MFEKEAEEWVLELNEKDPYAFPYGGEELRQAYKDGAGYGYKIAHEEAKVIIKDLLDNSDEYARQRAFDFFAGGRKCIAQ